VLAVLVSACGPPEAPELPVEIAEAPALAPERASSGEPLYDSEGDVLESTSRVAGLVLPRGIELVLDEERRHIYESSIPLTKMQRYFGVRLVTGQVDSRPGGAVTYVDALPRDVRGGQVRLDVTLEPSSRSRSRIEIVERRPPPVSPPSEAESLERLRERLRHAD
jgi:hypothetical protein